MNQRHQSNNCKGGRAMRSRKGMLLLGLAAFGAAGCNQSLDLTNPNAPTEQAVLTSLDGVIALAVGMQEQYAQSIEDYMVPNSLVTDEWGTDRKSLLSYQSLLSGEGFDPGYGVVYSPWANTFQVVKSANGVIEAAPQVGMGPALQAGVTSLAQLFKAMALGQAIQEFQAVPIQPTIEGSTPQPRDVVLDTVLSLLESARSGIANVSDADLAGFRSRVLGSGIDLRNTIDAMLARYYLTAGNNDQAIQAAGRVSPTVLSTLNYPPPTSNPIYNLASSARLNYVGGLKSFVDQAQAGDQRPSYWLDTSAPAHTGNPDSLLYPLRQYSSADASFPLYLPDEMKLIKAEADARNGDLGQAITLINEVRTQTTPAVAGDPVAGLPALSPGQLPDLQSVLEEIAYERRYELYMQGLRWEDMRRLPQPWNNTMTLEWLPTPTQECDANPNAGC